MTRLAPTRTFGALAGAALALGAAACGSAASTSGTPRALDRPVDVAFACFGDLRIVGSDGAADATDPVETTAQPLHSCSLRSYQKERPAGQEDLDGVEPLGPVNYYAFILQSVPGTVALGRWGTTNFKAKTDSQAGFTNAELTYQDADTLTPGNNSVAVGELPIAIVPDRAGCQMVTANAGSCDLSILDVASIADDDAGTPPLVRAQEVTNAAGEPVLARAAAMVAEPPDDAAQAIGVECPAEPEGLVYVAYPQCHLVAAIRAATGEIEGGVRFNADGTVEITDGNVSCPAECGDGGTPTDGERPVTVDLVADPTSGRRRMAIGADNSPTVTVVELDQVTYLPLAFDRVTLEGDVGVLDVALSPEIGMGGVGGFEDSGDSGGRHQFVYAVADDATVRVADVVGASYHECDTQVDPRYLRGVADVTLLSCLPVGDPATPPRRVMARGPGIVLEGKSVPTAVTIEQSAWNDDTLDPYLAPPDTPDPSRLTGYFAFVSTASGGTVVINIDDDIYPDFWTADDPLAAQVPLAIAHQIRDSVSGREAYAHPEELCPAEPASGSGGAPHVGVDGLSLLSDADFMNSLKTYTLPSVRRLECQGDDGEGNTVDVPVSELGYSAPPDVRDRAFPDLRAVRDERWTLTWEGLLSLDDGSHDVDGPITRHVLVHRAGGGMTVEDGSRPFCAMGVEPYDIAQLTGCDPDLDQCGLGETCYVHPDSVSGIGSCLPTDEAETLGARCRDFLVSQRRYTITESAAGGLTLVPRRHVLETTPIDGCTSDDQCQTLADYRAYLHSDKHPFEDTSASDKTFTCGPDPSRAAGVDQCMETCQDSTQCDDGTVCSNGFCVEGALPAAECVAGVQRFQVRAGDAITVIGSESGYLHPIVEDPATGQCVVDPAASPLLVGRIPLTAPPCPDPDDFTTFTPNPCSTTVPHTELVPDYDPASATCELRSDAGTLITRDAPAIRFKNPSLTFDLVDPYYGGDLHCREDRQGTLGKIPTVHHGYQLGVTVEAGFSGKRLAAAAVLPVNVVHGPEHSIWVVDEGERVPVVSGDASTHGQVFRVETWSLGIVNSIQ